VNRGSTSLTSDVGYIGYIGNTAGQSGCVAVTRQVSSVTPRESSLKQVGGDHQQPGVIHPQLFQRLWYRETVGVTDVTAVTSAVTAVNHV